MLLVHSTLRAEPVTPAAGEGSLADIPEENWVDEPPPEKPIARSGVVVLPFVGVAVAGAGKSTAELDCQSGGCDSNSLESEYSQNPNLLLGIDRLYQVLPQLRLGVELQWLPSVDVDYDRGNSSTEFGSEFAPVAVVEGIFGGKSAGAIRGFIGANFLFPDGDLEELIDLMDAACGSIASDGGSCEVASGPYTGLTFGAAGAFVRRVSEAAAIRLELSVQRLGFSGPNLKVSDNAGNRYEDRLSWSATRFSLRFGFEF